MCRVLACIRGLPAQVMTFSRRNLLDILLLPIGLVAFAALAWWAIYSGPTSADKIEARRAAAVERALSAPEYGFAEITMLGQTVQLSGLAPTEALKTRALRLAQEADGRGGPIFGGIKRVVDKIEVAPPVEDYVFRAVLFNGRVELSGVLPGVNERDRLVERLNKEGFWRDDIIDEVQFAEGVPDGDWVGAADLGLSQLVRLSDAELELDEKHIFLKGQAPNAAVKLQVLERMTRPPSGYTADVDLSGTAIWSARLDGDRLTLSGAVPDAGDRTEIVALASRFFGGEIVNSQIIRPMESRAWVSGVRTALPNFLQFRRGEMAYMGDELVIRGVAPQSVIDFLREDIVRVGALVDYQMIVEPIQPELMAFAGLADDETPSKAVCVAALNESLALGTISFRYGDEALKRESAAVLDGVEAVLRRCPDEVLEVSAYTDVDGYRIAGKELTEARQRTVSDYFIARGVPLNQIVLTKVKLGEDAPKAESAAEGGSQISLGLEE